MNVSILFLSPVTRSLLDLSNNLFINTMFLTLLMRISGTSIAFLQSPMPVNFPWNKIKLILCSFLLTNPNWLQFIPITSRWWQIQIQEISRTGSLTRAVYNFSISWFLTFLSLLSSFKFSINLVFNSLLLSCLFFRKSQKNPPKTKPRTSKNSSGWNFILSLYNSLGCPRWTAWRYCCYVPLLSEPTLVPLQLFWATVLVCFLLLCEALIV